jgi:uncharacterized protein YkwD
MVNKVALGILAVIILTAMTVGGLVGLQLSGDGTSGEGTQTPATTPTPQPTTDAPEPTATPGDGGSGAGTPTASPTPTPGVSSADIDRTEVEEAVRAAINDRRVDRDMGTLRFDERLREMARNHSRAMTDQGYVSHAAGGLTTQDRYRAFGLADQCRVPNNSNRGIRTGQSLETISKVKVGANYTFEADDRTIQVRNETQVARVVVDGWSATENERRKLLLEQAAEVGVGAVVTEEGEVYVTADLC